MQPRPVSCLMGASTPGHFLDACTDNSYGPVTKIYHHDPGWIVIQNIPRVIDEGLQCKI
jgi:hypothetical protein